MLDGWERSCIGVDILDEIRRELIGIDHLHIILLTLSSEAILVETAVASMRYH